MACRRRTRSPARCRWACGARSTSSGAWSTRDGRARGNGRARPPARMKRGLEAESRSRADSRHAPRLQPPMLPVVRPAVPPVYRSSLSSFSVVRRPSRLPRPAKARSAAIPGGAPNSSAVKARAPGRCAGAERCAPALPGWDARAPAGRILRSAASPAPAPDATVRSSSARAPRAHATGAWTLPCQHHRARSPPGGARRPYPASGKSVWRSGPSAHLDPGGPGPLREAARDAWAWPRHPPSCSGAWCPPRSGRGDPPAQPSSASARPSGGSAMRRYRATETAA